MTLIEDLLESVSLPFLSLAWIILAFATLAAVTPFIGDPSPGGWFVAWLCTVSSYWLLVTVLLVLKFLVRPSAG